MRVGGQLGGGRDPRIGAGWLVVGSRRHGERAAGKQVTGWGKEGRSSA